MSLGKIGIAGIVSLTLLLAYVAIGAIVYKQGPSPLETIKNMTYGDLPGPPGLYKGLVRGVSNATYQEESEIEGTPEARVHNAMRAAVRVDGALVFPMPGEWRTDNGSTLCHWEIAELLARAGKIKAEGYVAYWYIPGEGRSKVLVAEKVEAKGPNWELEAEHIHGSHGCAGMHHSGHGMGIGGGVHHENHSNDQDDWGDNS